MTLRVWHDTEEEKSKPANERIPRSTMIFTIDGGKERDCLVLTKFNPFEEWGTFQWEFTIGSNID